MTVMPCSIPGARGVVKSPRPPRCARMGQIWRDGALGRYVFAHMRQIWPVWAHLRGRAGYATVP